MCRQFVASVFGHQLVVSIHDHLLLLEVTSLGCIVTLTTNNSNCFLDPIWENQGGEWPYQIGVFWFYCRFFVSVRLLWKLLKTICITWWIPRGTAHNFFSWRSLVELGENGLWTWLPNIFLKFGVSLVVILTHLEICTGSLDNRFQKPLALSFQNTPWKTDLKMNCLRNFHFKINFFVYLVVW